MVAQVSFSKAETSLFFSQFQRPKHFPRRPCTAARAQLRTCFWGGGWGASSLIPRRLGCHWTPEFSFSICHPAFGERSLSPEGKRHVPSGKSRRIGRAQRRAAKEVPSPLRFGCCRLSSTLHLFFPAHQSTDVVGCGAVRCLGSPQAPLAPHLPAASSFALPIQVDRSLGLLLLLCCWEPTPAPPSSLFPWPPTSGLGLTSPPHPHFSAGQYPLPVLALLR